MGIKITKVEQGLLARPSDVQVTMSDTNQSRSESAIAINPSNPLNIVAASKKFKDPKKYQSTISTSYSNDGGDTWTESILPNPLDWNGMTDPALAFDSVGHLFLVVLPMEFSSDSQHQAKGIYVYKSNNGGQNWLDPIPLHIGEDDKPWVACDNNADSPFVGNIYVAWVGPLVHNFHPLLFSRSIDQGQTWIGNGSESSGSQIHKYSYAPEISVDFEGVVHIVWYESQTNTIEYIRSTDGGESFTPRVTAAKGIKGFGSSNLPSPSWNSFWYYFFPNATFRVDTFATGCGMPSRRFIVAWADMREGVARIYYRIAEQNGESWIGPESGAPMMPWLSSNDKVHNFHPQIIANKEGSVGCAYYQFGSKQGAYLIETKLTAAFSQGANLGPAIDFERVINVSDHPWDPSVNAPWSNGHSDLTFIGDYFGIDVVNNTFAVLWTDTRTGVQELFFDAIQTSGYIVTQELERSDTDVLTGVIDDSGGFIVVNGKVIPYPGPGPEFDLLNALVALDSVKKMNHPNKYKIVNSITNVMQNVLKDIRKSS